MLVVEDEDHVAHHQEEHEVAHDYTEFLREVEGGDGQIEAHHVEPKQHLVYQHQVEHEVEAIHLERKDLVRIVMVFPQLALLHHALRIIGSTPQLHLLFIVFSLLFVVRGIGVVVLSWIKLLVDCHLLEKRLELVLLVLDYEVMDEQPE